MNRTVAYFPRIVAESLSPLKEAVVISINDEMDNLSNLQEGWGDVLRLAFNDDDGQDVNSFNEAHALQILQFLDQHKDVEHMVVHCTAGVSRSAAVAMFVSECQQRELFQQTRWVDPERQVSRFNRYIYRGLHNTVQRQMDYEDMPGI